nr:unnamed protein product [Digitaria exilis]
MLYYNNFMVVPTSIFQVLVEANGSTRTLILNRPKQLNSLSSTMIKELLRCLLLILLLVIAIVTCFQGKGRAFCAGGDVAAGVQSIYNGMQGYTGRQRSKSKG